MTRFKKTTNSLCPLVSLTLALALAGCGGGGGGGEDNSNAPTPTPAGPVVRDAAGCIVGNWTVAGSAPMLQTDHFAIRGSSTVVTNEQATEAGAVLERAYAFYANTIGFKPPQCESANKRKINVSVTGTGSVSTAGTRDGVGYIDMTLFGFVSRHTLVHELVHVFQSATPGWSTLPRSFWETHANFMTAQVPETRSDLSCSEDAINSAYLAHGNARTRYCGWHFWERIAQKYGYAAVNNLWTQPFSGSNQYDALMADRGWTVARLNDEFADWAIRNVTWDYSGPADFDRGAAFRAAYGPYEPDSLYTRAHRLTTLEPIDLAQRRFAVPFLWAPQRWGYNMVRLVPDAGATSLTVSFRGVRQSVSATSSLPGGADEPVSIPAPASGWRWSVIVVDAQGAPRYEAIKQGADESLTVALRTGDQAVYLMVMAAPTASQHILDDQPYYSIYRYPWMVQIDGAMPWGYQANAPARIEGGRRHPNGNGWVGPDASVDASVYVGPYARVYSGTVRGNARIEDHAALWRADVDGNVRVSALSLLTGIYKLTGDSKIADVYSVIAGNGYTLSGTAQLLGDVQIYGDIRQFDAPIFTGFSRGVYYGMVLQADQNNVAKGSGRTGPVPEVTASPAYVWR